MALGQPSNFLRGLPAPRRSHTLAPDDGRRAAERGATPLLESGVVRIEEVFERL